MAEGIRILPFYILCDTSSSMRGDRIASVNRELPTLLHAILSDPIVDQKIRLGIVSFSTEARVDLPLSQLSQHTSMPTLSAGGQTNYAKGFTKTREVIEKDLKELKSSGYTPYRPCVYLITDGRPGDGWKRIRDNWVDRLANRYAPNIISFGVAEADQEVLTRVSTQFTFLADQGSNSANALKEVLHCIASSVVGSARNNQAALVIPNGGETFRVIDNKIEE